MDASNLGNSVRTRAILGLIAASMAFVAFPVCAQEVAVKGAQFFKNGSAWLPKGVVVEAFRLPEALLKGDKGASQSRGWWGHAESEAISKSFGADTIVFVVGQRGLDPKSTDYDVKYREEIGRVVKETRVAGYVVIVAMDAGAPVGAPRSECMPGEATARAWKELAPEIAADAGVLAEVFSAPCKGVNPTDLSEWASGMQASIDVLRAAGSKSVVLVDGVRSGRATNGLLAKLHDPQNRLAMAVRPYMAANWFEATGQWQRDFGDEALRSPTLATAWNATASDGCVDARTPDLALSMTRFLVSKRIGLVGFAIDSVSNPLVKDHIGFKPTDYSAFKNCGDGSMSGAGALLAKFPRD